MQKGKMLLHRHDSLDFGSGEAYSGDHFRFLFDRVVNVRKLDYLIFTDSRGTATPDPGEKPWVTRVIESLSIEHGGLVCLSRPKTLTVLFTLVNFLKANRIQCRHLITNLGMVDKTPKKLSYVTDIVEQSGGLLDQSALIRLEEFALDSGTHEPLFTLNYANVISTIAGTLDRWCEKTLFIPTLELSPTLNDRMQRRRPESFYSQLAETNRLLSGLTIQMKSATLLPPKSLTDDQAVLQTYDCVHLTSAGHKALAEEVCSALQSKE